MVHELAKLLLMIAAVYCGGVWAWLAVKSIRNLENWEEETFHLGLCFVIAVGFLYIGS